MKNNNSNDSGIIFGFLIIGVGVLILARKLGFFVPDWIISWPMILVAIGTFTLIKHGFKSFFGSVVLGLGLYFLFEREFGFDFGIERFIFPVALILLGIYLVTQKRKENNILADVQRKMDASMKNLDDQLNSGTSDSTSQGNPFVAKGATFSERLNVDAIFSGVNKRVMTKNFQGGKLTAAFGGIDLDFTQADFNGMVTVQVDVIFGGMKLVVPPHWDVRTEVTNIAAGIEDKRIYREAEVDPQKVLVLKGTVFFGGLEIKSF
ncbi:LiaI-LiaF-like domain-containing protein [Algoriphagus namhaensis]|uniref:LiaI-LiaF-like domain-containing protein n=1 Tax=Algoriphagus namhaensis TaxID=915353 RepID=A0ABV8AKK0_9BACT